MKQDSSLKPYSGRLPVQHQIGSRNYENTAHYAQFSYLNSGVPISIDIVEQDSTYDLLVFAHDAPVIWKAGMHFDADFGTTPAVSLVQFEEQPISVRGDYGTNNILVPDANNLVVNAYQYRTGVTLTNAVRCAGYLGSLEVPDRGYMDGQEEAKGTCHVTFLSLGGQINGPVVALDGDGLNPSYLALYLLESDYTQAIHDAGDIILTTTGGLSIVSRVVGLYAKHEGGIL